MTRFCYQLVERRVRKGYKTFIEEKRLVLVLQNSSKMLVEWTEILKNIDRVFFYVLFQSFLLIFILVGKLKMELQTLILSLRHTLENTAVSN